MKRFSFPLGTLLDLRRHELQAAEARLGQIQARKYLAASRADAVDQQFIRSSDRAMEIEVATGARLQAIERHLSSLVRERLEEKQAEQTWERERHRQLLQVIEVRRKVKLLESLRERKLEEYLLAAEREQENQIAEFHLAKWVRQRPQKR